MDYRMDTAAASHKAAAVWMLPDACNAFEQLYWGDHIKQGIAIRHDCRRVSACLQ
jgi:hypothetical protein